jgi:hypothetical protein
MGFLRTLGNAVLVLVALFIAFSALFMLKGTPLGAWLGSGFLAAVPLVIVGFWVWDIRRTIRMRKAREEDVGPYPLDESGDTDSN